MTLQFSGRLPWPHVPQLHQRSQAECQQRAQLPVCVTRGMRKGTSFLGVEGKQKRFRTGLTDPAERKQCCFLPVLLPD